MARVKRDDTVELLAGRDRGKRGKIRRILVRSGRAIVAEVNLMKRHQKPGRAGARQAGIIDIEAPVHLSNLALVCPKCGKATKTSRRLLGDGSRARFCKKCQEQV